MNLIENILEPDRLLLTWKGKSDRNLRVIGELFRENGGARLNYLVDSEDFKFAQKAGFNYCPAFPDINKTYITNVLEVFSRRIPPKTREDYDEFLQEIRLSQNVNVSDFALLGYSEVKLPSDGFSIINSYDRVDGDCEFLTEIAGLRYQEQALEQLKNNKLTFSSRVTIEVEDNNKHDENAVSINFEGLKLGYINRVQNKAFRRWIAQNRTIELEVEKINGTEDRPSVILFVKVR